jgi:8-oxo-dGTP pyrophosphatase MutT (NUDIX family)
MNKPYFPPSIYGNEYDFLKPKIKSAKGTKPPKDKRPVNWRAGKKCTCALACITPSGRVLICHPTNGPYKFGWGFPKGIKDDTDADEITAARRELREETGLDLPDDLLYINCGTFEYMKEKVYRLFAVKLDYEIDLSTLHCESMFTDKDGTQKPEIDKYALVLIDRCYKDMTVKQSLVVKSCLSKLRATLRGTAKDTRDDWER